MGFYLLGKHRDKVDRKYIKKWRKRSSERKRFCWDKKQLLGISHGCVVTRIAFKEVPKMVFLASIMCPCIFCVILIFMSDGMNLKRIGKMDGWNSGNDGRE